MKLQKLLPHMIGNEVRETVGFYVEVLGFKLNMAASKNSESIESKYMPIN